MSDEYCRFELPKGWKEDCVYTKWIGVLTKRIEEKIILEIIGYLKLAYTRKFLIEKLEAKLNEDVL